MKLNINLSELNFKFRILTKSCINTINLVFSDSKKNKKEKHDENLMFTIEINLVMMMILWIFTLSQTHKNHEITEKS